MRRCTLLSLLFLVLPFSALAAWPEKPIRIIVPAAPGSPPEVTVRVIADLVSAQLKQPVVVEPRDGGMGIIGMSAVARAAPDGYTFGAVNPQTAALPALKANVPFSVQDLVPVVQITSESLILIARSDLPIKSVADLSNYLKSRGDKATMGSTGIGTPSHLGMELLLQRLGGRPQHVPYQGVVATARSVAAGEVDFALLGTAGALPMVTSGRVQPIAVSGDRRNGSLPDVPTFIETGYGDVETRIWVGLSAPPGTPANIVNAMNEAVNAALKSPEVIERFSKASATARGGTAAEFDAYFKSEMLKWGTLIRRLGLPPQ